MKEFILMHPFIAFLCLDLVLLIILNIGMFIINIYFIATTGDKWLAPEPEHSQCPPASTFMVGVAIFFLLCVILEEVFVDFIVYCIKKRKEKNAVQV